MQIITVQLLGYNTHKTHIRNLHSNSDALKVRALLENTERTPLRRIDSLVFSDTNALLQKYLKECTRS